LKAPNDPCRHDLSVDQRNGDSQAKALSPASSWTHGGQVQMTESQQVLVAAQRIRQVPTQSHGQTTRRVRRVRQREQLVDV
jgi:hypothetical protein